MKPFVDQIKEQLQKQGAIQAKITIGEECCTCDCNRTKDDFNVIVLVNKPGGCKAGEGKGEGGEGNGQQNGGGGDADAEWA